MASICCCCPSKNDDKNVNLDSKNPSNVTNDTNRIRIPSISVTVTPEPTEPEDKNRPIFIKKSETIEPPPITEQPKNTLTVKTTDKDIELKAKQPNLQNNSAEPTAKEEEETINEPNTSINELEDLNNKYNGYNNFAFADEVDGENRLQKNSTNLRNQTISKNLIVANEEKTIYNDFENRINNLINNTNNRNITNNIVQSTGNVNIGNICTTTSNVTIEYIENGERIKRTIQFENPNESVKIQIKDGVLNYGFDKKTNINNNIINNNINNINNNNSNGQITPPLQNDPSFNELRRILIENSLEKLLDKIDGKPKPTPRKSNNNTRPTEQPIIHRPTPTALPGVTVDGDIYKNMRLSSLETHNRLRAQHGCPPLKENDELNKLADEWAKYLVANCGNNLIHRPNNKYGENLYWTNNRNGHVTMGVHAWYDEIKLYNFTKHGFSKECGHFTQLIWRDTVELGTGVAKKGNEMIVVCNYNPPGNYEGEFNDYSVPSLTAEDELTNEMIQYYKEQIRTSSLTAHNRLRALHGSPPLQRSDELERVAEQMLEYSEYNDGKIPKLPDGLNVARNYYISSHPLAHITVAIQDRYDQGFKLYNYDRPSDDNNDVKGFIQLIWRDTVELGSAIKRIGKEIRIIFLYSPGRQSLDIYSDYLVPRLVTNKLHMPLEMYPEQMRWSCLEAHNRLRDLHGCPPLVGNSDLDQFAEEWAQHLASVNKLYHRSNSKYGENLYWSSDKFGHVTIAAQNWYNEIKLYDYNNPGFSKETGHFTQLVWKDSIELGTGIARRGDSLYVVCVYNPPGNFVGRFNDYYIPRPIQH